MEIAVENCTPACVDRCRTTENQKIWVKIGNATTVGTVLRNVCLQTLTISYSAALHKFALATVFLSFNFLFRNVLELCFAQVKLSQKKQGHAKPENKIRRLKFAHALRIY